MSTAIVIVVGKSCETDVVLTPLMKFMGTDTKLIRSDKDATRGGNAIFLDVNLYEIWKSSYATSVIIITEENAFALKSIPEDGVYTITYNTDKVTTSLRIILQAKSRTAANQFDRLAAIRMISTQYNKVLIWSPTSLTFDVPANCIVSPAGSVIEREVTAIIFYETPTADEYYSFVRRVIYRGNYKDRAKSGVIVKVYFLVQNTQRRDADKLLSDISHRSSAMKNITNMATKQITSNKDGKLSFEDRKI